MSVNNAATAKGKESARGMKRAALPKNARSGSLTTVRFDAGDLQRLWNACMMSSRGHADVAERIVRLMPFIPSGVRRFRSAQCHSH